MKVVFMGTPEFAVTILDNLIKNDIEIAAVITAPDKPAGRGRKLNQSAVKVYALEKELNILQPTNLKDEAFLSELKEINAELFVVVAFRMLPEVVWQMPEKGTINLHASLLPNYRGAAPINWAIINGEKETGVTTFFIEKEIDTGAIIEQRSLSISEEETLGDLYSRLMHLGAETTLNTVRSIEQNDIKPIEQSQFDRSNNKPAPKIFKEDCYIDFNSSALATHNMIRGLNPFPAAWCKLINTDTSTMTFKLYKSEVTDIPNNTNEIISEKRAILFPCSDYYIRISEIQPQGKRKMKAIEFLAGNKMDDFRLVDNETV